jgi:hypothetical protein
VDVPRTTRESAAAIKTLPVKTLGRTASHFEGTQSEFFRENLLSKAPLDLSIAKARVPWAAYLRG